MINKFIIGNWKMNGDSVTIANLIHEIINNLPKDLSCGCVVLPPFIFIPQVYELIKNSNIFIFIFFSKFSYSMSNISNNQFVRLNFLDLSIIKISVMILDNFKYDLVL